MWCEQEGGSRRFFIGGDGLLDDSMGVGGASWGARGRRRPPPTPDRPTDTHIPPSLVPESLEFFSALPCCPRSQIGQFCLEDETRASSPSDLSDRPTARACGRPAQRGKGSSSQIPPSWVRPLPNTAGLWSCCSPNHGPHRQPG
jgi:hypothetical protein